MFLMPIPNFQNFLLPILRLAADGQNHSTREFEESAANALNLSAEQRAEMLKSGTMTVVRDRTGWAYYHLFRAGLLSRPARGVYAITDRGRQVLAAFPERIDQKILRQFPEYLEYVTARPGKETAVIETNLDSETPQQTIEQAFEALQKKLAREVLDSILVQTPAFFEQLVVSLLVKMGYGGSREDAGRAIGQSGDEGIDGVIKEDRLGLDIIYVQAKRWKVENKVSRSDVQGFVGSLAGKQAHKGVFITTSSFQDSAREYVRHLSQKVSLIDGVQLAELCIEFGLGVSAQTTYVLKKIDLDYFEQS